MTQEEILANLEKEILGIIDKYEYVLQCNRGLYEGKGALTRTHISSEELHARTAKSVYTVALEYIRRRQRANIKK